jgi:hypothetical protein
MFNLPNISKDHLPPSKSNRSKYPFKNMEVGDSVFYEGKTTQGKEVVYAYNYARKSGKKFAAKTIENGVRIWRTE